MTWLARRGLDQLSPPEVERVLLELPAERSEYVGLVQDLSGWPERSAVGRRVPSEAEIQELSRIHGLNRAVALLEDQLAIDAAADAFDRIFVLDPLYDTGDLLYAAWHDVAIRDEHARHLAQHASHLARIAPLLQSQHAILAPDHLPGSWDPRPGWRRLRPNADDRTRSAWSLRQALVLVYWADRLDATVCTSAEGIGDILATTLTMGTTDLPDPALLLRRALDGRALDAEPLLPRTPLRRELLCLFAPRPSLP